MLCAESFLQSPFISSCINFRFCYRLTVLGFTGKITYCRKASKFSLDEVKEDGPRLVPWAVLF
jgi:hypothetical protein